jgi:hypothetical protein
VPRLRRKAGDGNQTPREAYAGLRWAALNSGRNGSVPGHDAHPGVYGLVTDFSSGGDWVTVTALGDDTASMYASTGGGVTGAGGHADVAAVTHRLLAAVQAHLAAFDAADDGGYPPHGTVRFHLLTEGAGRYADIPGEAFWAGGAHPLRPVIDAAQDVLTSLREADSRRRPADGRTPQERYAQDRWTALRSGRDGSIPGNDAHPDVYGLVTDSSRDDGQWTTVVTLGDNKPSVLRSTGGGPTMVTEYEPVAAVVQRLLTTVQAHLAAFDAADDGGYPPPGMVRFHLLTGAAGRYADIPGDAFSGRAAHPLNPVGHGVRAVLAEVRALETRARRAREK